MLTWMRSFGNLQRFSVECTGSYGASLLRYMQVAGMEVLEVTAPDKLDRRPLRANKSETFDCLKFTLEGAGE
jgi:transposase